MSHRPHMQLEMVASSQTFHEKLNEGAMDSFSHQPRLDPVARSVVPAPDMSAAHVTSQLGARYYYLGWQLTAVYILHLLLSSSIVCIVHHPNVE